MVAEKEKIQKFIKTIYEKLTNDYRMDYYIPKYKKVEGVNWSQIDTLVADTIQSYRKHHSDFSVTSTQKAIICELFKHPKTKKVVVSFENKKILLELYKVLGYIDRTQQYRYFLTDPSRYPGNYFAKIQSDLKEVKAFRMHHKKNIVGICRLDDPREARMRYWLATLYYKNRTLTKFFLHTFLLQDLERMTLLEDDETKKLINGLLEFFLVQRTTESSLIKSLGILLYYEVFSFLKLSHTDAAIYTQNILYEFFNEKINMEEFKRHIYIKSSLAHFPIFGAAKKNPISEDDKAYIRRSLIKELGNLKWDDETSFDLLFQSFFAKPHIQYLHKYPGELFRINPKYSS